MIGRGVTWSRRAEETCGSIMTMSGPEMVRSRLIEASLGPIETLGEPNGSLRGPDRTLAGSRTTSSRTGTGIPEPGASTTRRHASIARRHVSTSRGLVVDVGDQRRHAAHLAEVVHEQARASRRRRWIRSARWPVDAMECAVLRAGCRCRAGEAPRRGRPERCSRPYTCRSRSASGSGRWPERR